MIRHLFASILLLAALAACQAVPRPDAGGESRPAESGLPERPDGRRYQVAGDESDVRIIAYPAGSMARLGHPHVIGGNAISGEVIVAENFHRSWLRLEFRVDALEVDRPRWRRDEGFDPDMSESAIADTRENMLSADQLDAAQYPIILIESLAISGPTWQPDIDIRITLAGVQRELTVPVALTLDDDHLTATGRLLIRQSDFGIEPFSAAGGSLRVADELLIRFRIKAQADQ